VVRTALVLASAVVLTFAAGAWADGDPASDTLYTRDVFLPLSTGVSKPLARKLAAAARAARQDGRPVRVALIASRDDLSAVPSLFGHPQRYARFLGAELRYLYRGRLLVVMPQGAALSKGGRLLPSRAVSRAVVGRGGDGLARAAVALVTRLSGRAAAAPRAKRHARPARHAAQHARVRRELAAGSPGGVSVWKAAAIASAAVAGFVVLGLLVAARHRKRRPEYPAEAFAVPAPDPNDPYRYRVR
jgi:hypothetical protein